jgi:hypothetical protein
MLQENVKSNNILAYVQTFGLWLITAVLAFFEILAVRELIFNLYARLVAATDGAVQSTDYFLATSLGHASVYVMVFVAIAVIIGGFEYHHKHVGEARSQKILLWTVGIQLVILLAYLWV